MTTEDLKNYNRCNVCLEEQCNGKHNCHCLTCKLFSKCPKFLSATIRITNKCTQQCNHCCFSSHPKSDIMMSIEMAEKIAEFIKNNNIFHLNVMGGEFFCNPNWFRILELFIDAAWETRIVTNSDWAHNKIIREGLIKLNEKYKNWHMSLSNDKWHTNAYVDDAVKFLEEYKITYNLVEPNVMTENSIVPIGRGELFLGCFYSTIGTYCQQDVHKYSISIDEDGNIYKCSFGVLKYTNITDYLSGGFEKRFKEFNKNFYSVFMPNCRSCISSVERYSLKINKPLIIKHE